MYKINFISVSFLVTLLMQRKQPKPCSRGLQPAWSAGDITTLGGCPRTGIVTRKVEDESKYSRIFGIIVSL